MTVIKEAEKPRKSTKASKPSQKSNRASKKKKHEAMIPKTCLELTHTEAKKFFLKPEIYCSLELPEYYDFSKLLKKLSSLLKNKRKLDRKNPKAYSGNSKNVNYKIFENKNGEYAYRLHQIMHPALYVELVHKITEKNNWNKILGRFAEFKKNSRVECASIPATKGRYKTNKAAVISQWWEKVEKSSIKLAIDYGYLFRTDIVDCYGSIYTHSIDWAISTKEKAKKERRGLGNFIDSQIKSMSYGQTNGIPQGSVLMDFIAEMVLGYADIELTKKIKSLKIKNKEYHIIRYRDDYLIFVNNPNHGNEIIKALSEVLIELGMRLSPEKTSKSEDIIISAIKSDKLAWNSTWNKGGKSQEKMLTLYQFGLKHPNSGTFARELPKFYRYIENQQSIKDDAEVLISIAVNIAIKNPKTYVYISAIIGKLLQSVKSQDKRIKIIKKIITRFNDLPNTEYMHIWLCRIILGEVAFEKDVFFSSKYKKLYKEFNKYEICQIAYFEIETGRKYNLCDIWNSEWLHKSVIDVMSDVSIIDKEKVAKISRTIPSTHLEKFWHSMHY